MTLASTLQATFLRYVGRYRDAEEVEEFATPEPTRKPVPPEEIPSAGDLPAPQPALVAYGSDFDVLHGAAESSAGVSSGGKDGTTAAVSPEHEAGGGSMVSGGGGSSSGGGSVAGADDASLDAENAANPASANDTNQDMHKPIHQHPDPKTSIQEDPFAGLLSDRIKEKLERDAFASASGAAQDSAIGRRAEQIGSAKWLIEMRAARSARIAELNGEIPNWAQGNPEFDPALIRAAEASAKAADRGHSPAHAPYQPPSRSSSRMQEREQDGGREM